MSDNYAIAKFQVAQFEADLIGIRTRSQDEVAELSTKPARSTLREISFIPRTTAWSKRLKSCRPNLTNWNGYCLKPG